MTASVAIVIDNDLQSAGTQLRLINRVMRDHKNMTVTYETQHVKSWPTMKEFFAEYGTGLSDYLFDELEKEYSASLRHRKQAKVSLELSNRLKAENAVLRSRIESLEKQLEKAKANS